MDGPTLPVAATGGSPPPSTDAHDSPISAGPAGSAVKDGQRHGQSRWATVVWALRRSIVPWLVARLIVGLALGVAHLLVTHHHLTGAAAARVHEGLLGWDAGWYQSIAGHGYAGAGHSALRFFPLLPLLARGLSVLPGISVGAAVVAVANVSALVATAVLVLLVRVETGDERLAGRSAWLLCLAPAAFTFVMGYAEATLLALAAGTFIALRTRHWAWAALLGAAAGLTRPLGALLLVPAALEAGRGWRGWRGTSSGPRLARVAAVAGPVVGTAAFLGWVGWRYGDGLAPLRLQEESGHHGRLVDPLITLGHDASFLVHGRHLGEALHLPWVLLVLALLVVSFRFWPASYGFFAAAVLAVALTGSNLDSFERYALSAFPLVLAAATVTAGRRVFPLVLVLSSSALFGYALLAFANRYVP
jgi:hypothetical protein